MTETVKGEVLEQLMSRLEDGRPDPDELAESWRESERRYYQRKEDQRRWEWIRFSERMAAVHAELSEEHRSRAERLLGRGA